MALTVVQLLPDLNVGGVERGTVEIANALVRAGHRAIVVSNHGRMVAQLNAAGAEHIALPIGHKSLFTLKYIGVLKRLFVEQQVDIVHARSRLPAWIGRLALNRISNRQRPHWVTTVHGPYSVNRYSKIMVSGERVIAISAFIRDYILHNYPDVDPDRISIIHRGVDSHQFPYGFRPSQSWLDSWQRHAPAGGDKRYLLFPGRLTRWKGQLTFIEVMARLVELGLPVHGLIAGGQSDQRSAFETELRAAIEARGLQNDVTLLGDRDDLKALFAIAAISFSLTSEPEAFGRTTLEALSIGTPVIGFDHGGTGEILRAVLPAGLVPRGDIDAVVQKVRSFLAEPPMVPRNHTMTLENMQAQTLTLYEALANQQAGAAHSHES